MIEIAGLSKRYGEKLAGLDQPTAGRVRVNGRERTVFGLLAAVRSNREIAAVRQLSEGTVKIHVGRILAKLGLRDRIQGVVLAYETGLITPGGR